jgi:hypothetical protein
MRPTARAALITPNRMSVIVIHEPATTAIGSSSSSDEDPSALGVARRLRGLLRPEPQDVVPDPLLLAAEHKPTFLTVFDHAARPRRRPWVSAVEYGTLSLPIVGNDVGREHDPPSAS